MRTWGRPWMIVFGAVRKSVAVRYPYTLLFTR